MRYYLVIIILTFTQLSCNEKPKQSHQMNTENKSEIEFASNRTISLINLISTPEKYHRKKIRIIGFMNLEFEGNAIYLHKEDYERSIYSNGFWVSIDEPILKKINEEKLNRSYVMIEGVFNMNQRGHMGLWSGEIEHITRIIKWN